MGVGTVIKLYKKSFLLLLITPSLKGYQEAHSTKVGGNIPSAVKKRNYTNLKNIEGILQLFLLLFKIYECDKIKII